MSQSFKILFHLKKGKGTNENVQPIYVRLTVDGKRVEWSVQRSCEESKWNKLTGRMAGSKEEAKKLNAYLDAIQASIYDVQREHAQRKERVTAEQVRTTIIYGSEEKAHTLLEVYQYHNEQFEKLVGIEYSFRTLQKFRTCLRTVREFLRFKYHREDIPLSMLNHKFLTDYEFYLKTEWQLHHNSAMVCLKKLKKIIRLCIANDWLDKDPFRSFKITSKETHRNFLLKDELERLISEPLTSEKLRRVRDVFVFSCYTGLSYTDVSELTPNDISIGIDGIQWVFTKRAKTDTSSRIPLLPIAYDIIQKYATDPQVVNTGLLLPKMSNQKLNHYLKEISVICGFNKKLTFHCARPDIVWTTADNKKIGVEITEAVISQLEFQKNSFKDEITDCVLEKLRDQLPFNFDITVKPYLDRKISQCQKNNSIGQIVKILLAEAINLKDNEILNLYDFGSDIDIYPPDIKRMILLYGYRNLPDGIKSIKIGRWDSAGESWNPKLGAIWVPDLTLDTLSEIIKKKETKLEKYAVCDEYWLVIWESGGRNSYYKNISAFDPPNTKFQKVFLARTFANVVVVLK